MSTYWEMWLPTEGQGIEFEDVPDDSKDQWREPCDSRATTPVRGEQRLHASDSPLTVMDWMRAQGIFTHAEDL